MTGLLAPSDFALLPKHGVTRNLFDVRPINLFTSNPDDDNEFVFGQMFECSVPSLANDALSAILLVKECISSAVIPVDSTANETGRMLKNSSLTQTDLAKTDICDGMTDFSKLPVGVLFATDYTLEGNVIADIPVNHVFYAIVRGIVQVRAAGIWAVGNVLKIDNTGRFETATFNHIGYATALEVSVDNALHWAYVNLLAPIRVAV